MTDTRDFSLWNTGDNNLNSISFLAGDYTDYKKYVTGKFFALKDAFDTLATTESEIEKKSKYKFLELENKRMKNEISELRGMLKKFVNISCENKSSKQSENSRQNQSTVPIQVDVENSNPNSNSIQDKKMFDNTQKYELNKWLIPKRSTVNIKTNNGSRNQLEIKNRFSSLYIESEDNLETCKLQNNNEETNHLIEHRIDQHVTKRKRPKVTEKSHQEKNLQHLSNVVPGLKTYSEALRSLLPSSVRNANSETTSSSSTNPRTGKIHILSDSIAKQINMKQFNRAFKCERVFSKAFPGAAANHMLHYITPTLIDDQPDTVVIHVGINNLLKRNRKFEENDLIRLADEIIQIGLLCKESNVRNILISGLTYTTKVNIKLIRKVNELLKLNCENNNFYYIDNENITKYHLWKDGIHLNNTGTINIANNFLESLNIFFQKAKQDLKIP